MAERAFGSDFSQRRGRGLSASACRYKCRGSATSDGTDRRCGHSLQSASRQGLELDRLLFLRGHGAMAPYGSANYRSSFRAGKSESEDAGAACQLSLSSTFVFLVLPSKQG